MENIEPFNENKNLLKDMKTFGLHKPFDQLPDEEQKKYADLVSDILGESLFCTREWSGWAYNTMSAEDFHEAADDGDYVYEKAEELYNKILGER